jgi:hypothetical protein
MARSSETFLRGVWPEVAGGVHREACVGDDLYVVHTSMADCGWWVKKKILTLIPLASAYLFKMQPWKSLNDSY